MSIDYQTLPLKELKDIHSQVTKAIATFEERVKQKALAELHSKAKELGFSLEELTGAAPGKKIRKPAVAKYANPADATDTWTGRGRKPRWFVDALAQGKAPEDLAI